MTPKCTWGADRGWLSPEHLADCAEGDCRGCRPCGKSHCAMRGSCANHVDHSAGIVTCAGCIGRTRTDLQAIEDRYAEIPDEAMQAGVDSEAANLAGPAASPDQVKARRKAGVHVEVFAPPRGNKPAIIDDPHHPYSVLGRWDMALREDYDQPTDLLVSVSRAKDYLASMLGVFAQDQPQAFEEFASDVATCRTHLESVLSDSRQPERGAPCPSCREAGEEKPARLAKRYGSDKSGADDRWVCSTNAEHWWREADYRLRVAGDYLDHAPALTADQMHEVHGIKPGTLRKWANDKPSRVDKRGYDGAGRQLYDVVQAKAARDSSARMSA